MESFKPIEAYEIAKGPLAKGELKDKLFKLIHWDKMDKNKLSTAETLAVAAGSVRRQSKADGGAVKIRR